MNQERRALSAPEPFVILAMPRTGSHHLKALANEHPNVLTNGEILNPWDTDWPGVDRTEMSDRELLELAFVRFPRRDEKYEVSCVGCKVNEPQFHERPTFFDELAAWPRLKVIALQRRNLLESFRSFIQARESGRWLAPSADGPAPVPPRVKLSPAGCESYFRSAEEFYGRIFARFSPEKIHEIYYEDLRDRPGECMAGIWDFLGVSPHLLSGCLLLQQQETRPLSEAVLNYAELRGHFRGTPYQAFFE
ncbi:Nodulation protein H [Candidatus Protofrankia californiensis]|nr:Nodulation protein H [Candidatus Protofrankia californiensis]